MVSRSSTASDTKTPKTTGKAGGQTSFEDEMRSGRKSSAKAGKTEETTSSETTDVEKDTTITTGSNNGDTGSEIMETSDNDKGNGASELTSENEGKGPEDAEFTEVQGLDISGGTSISDLMSSAITVDDLLKQAGTDSLNATPDQLSTANAAVEQLKAGNEDGSVSIDSLRETINDIVQQSDNKPAAGTAVALTGRGRKLATSQADNEPVVGKIMTQRDFYRAILQVDTCYAYLKFGKCARPFKVTKKEAQQVAATIMAYETPADHELEFFAEIRHGQLFIGHA